MWKAQSRSCARRHRRVKRITSFWKTAAIVAVRPEAKRAWHAGVSSWAGEEDINSCSIGVEIVNRGHDWGYPEFPLRRSPP